MSSKQATRPELRYETRGTELTDHHKILSSYTFIYAAAAVSSTKLSILLLYYRIFGRNAGIAFSVCLGFGGCLAISYPITVWATMASSCKPLSYFWERFAGDTGTCIDIINMINDVVVLVIPIPQIWKLQMGLRRRLGVIGILALGGL